jgi:hypothetical protein
MRGSAQSFAISKVCLDVDGIIRITLQIVLGAPREYALRLIHESPDPACQSKGC